MCIPICKLRAFRHRGPIRYNRATVSHSRKTRTRRLQDGPSVAEFLITKHFWPWLAYTLAALVQIFLIVNLVAVGALLFIWLERKVSGRIQDRLGPTRVGGRFGWLQTLADGLKLLTKEDLMPEGADGFLFKIAPYVSFCASLAAFMAIPFAGGRLSVRRAALERGRVLHPGRARAGSVRRDPGRLLVGFEVVAVRRDARGGPGGELRGAAGHVRRRAGAARRVDGPGRHRRPAGRACLRTGSSSTIRSRSSRFGSTSPARRPA